jgi:CubicO group peptidase (beta-lactamase class C family)
MRIFVTLLTIQKTVLLKTTVLLLPALLLLYACSGAKNEGEKSASTAGAITDSIPGPGLSPDARRYNAAIKSFVDSTFRNGSLNGSILVAREGQILYEQYGGYASYRSRRDSITANSAFHLASVSKTITAMAVLRLWQEGKLNIQDSVSKYLPGFPRPAVTIKSLLNHRSGLPNYVHYMDRLGWDKKQFVTNQDVLDFLIERHKDIDIGPADRRFSYSNTNYALLALIVEKVSGMGFAAYLKQTFFDPLNMQNTYVYTREDSARSMPSYFYNGRQYAFDFLDLVYGDKNIYSTVKDLLKFDVALSSGLLINNDILEAAFSPYSFEKPGTHNYGLGWRMLLLKNGKKIIYHNGWWHGNRTAFYRLPDEKVTIIALCNNDSKMIYSVRKLADLFGNYMQTIDGDADAGRSIVRSSRVRKKQSLARNSTKSKNTRTVTASR